MKKVGEVIVMGAGPVGMLTALALAQQDFSVTVIEAAADLSDAPRAMVYFAPTLVALRELGVLDDVQAQGVIGRSFGHHVPGLDFKAVVQNSCMAGVTFDYQLHCGQDIVARVAMKHAQALGVNVLMEHELTGLAQDADGVTVSVSTPQGNRELRADWCIAADGARSVARRLLDIEFEGHTWANRFVATNVYCDFASLGYEPANFVCDPVYSGVVAVIDRDGLWRLTYQEDAALPAETFMERLPERYARFIPEGVPYEIKAANPYAIHQRCAATLRKGRVMLAGDAAHITNPSGGLGLTTGLWTGMILADVLGAVIRGEADQSILDRYSDERRRVYWEVTSPAASQNKCMMEEADPEQRRKDLTPVAAAAQDPAVARMMMSFPFKVLGDPLRAGSRWANADPTKDAGISVAGRTSQLA